MNLTKSHNILQNLIKSWKISPYLSHRMSQSLTISQRISLILIKCTKSNRIFAQHTKSYRISLISPNLAIFHCISQNLTNLTKYHQISPYLIKSQTLTKSHQISPYLISHHIPLNLTESHQLYQKFYWISPIVTISH